MDSTIKISENTKRIFFDFDGVLVDSNKYKENSIEKSIKTFEENRDIQEFSINFFNENAGLAREKKLLKFFDKKKVQNIMTKYSFFCNNFLANANLTVGSEELIYHLSSKYPKIKLYILSGAEKEEISKFLKSKNIFNKFEDLLCSEKSKFEHLNSFKLLNNDFFIGDSKNDLKVSKLFSLRFILVSEFGSSCSMPDKDELDDSIISVDNLKELLIKIV